MAECHISMREIWLPGLLGQGRYHDHPPHALRGDHSLSKLKHEIEHIKQGSARGLLLGMSIGLKTIFLLSMYVIYRFKVRGDSGLPPWYVAYLLEILI
jgi:hypothetical protein